MKNWVKYTVAGILAAGFIVGTVFLTKAAAARRSGLVCKAVSVILADDYRFVNEEDVGKMILNLYGNCLGNVLDSIALDRIETILDSQSAILKSQAWVTDDGLLNISITQRKPVIRFMDGENGYYVDKTGYVFPLFERFTADTPVIEGPCPKDSVWIAHSIKLVEYMGKDWLDRTDHIQGNRAGELTLQLRSGAEEFRFGQPEDFDTKFTKIIQYLNTIKPQGREYTKVDLTLKGQLVCK